MDKNIFEEYQKSIEEILPVFEMYQPTASQDLRDRQNRIISRIRELEVKREELEKPVDTRDVSPIVMDRRSTAQREEYSDDREGYLLREYDKRKAEHYTGPAYAEIEKEVREIREAKRSQEQAAVEEEMEKLMVEQTELKSEFVMLLEEEKDRIEANIQTIRRNMEKDVAQGENALEEAKVHTQVLALYKDPKSSVYTAAKKELEKCKAKANTLQTRVKRINNKISKLEQDLGNLNGLLEKLYSSEKMAEISKQEDEMWAEYEADKPSEEISLQESMREEARKQEEMDQAWEEKEAAERAEEEAIKQATQREIEEYELNSQSAEEKEIDEENSELSKEEQQDRMWAEYEAEQEAKKQEEMDQAWEEKEAAEREEEVKQATQRQSVEYENSNKNIADQIIGAESLEKEKVGNVENVPSSEKSAVQSSIKEPKRSTISQKQGKWQVEGVAFTFEAGNQPVYKVMLSNGTEQKEVISTEMVVLDEEFDKLEIKELVETRRIAQAEKYYDKGLEIALEKVDAEYGTESLKAYWNLLREKEMIKRYPDRYEDIMKISYDFSNLLGKPDDSMKKFQKMAKAGQRKGIVSEMKKAPSFLMRLIKRIFTKSIPETTTDIKERASMEQVLTENEVLEDEKMEAIKITDERMMQDWQEMHDEEGFDIEVFVKGMSEEKADEYRDLQAKYEADLSQKQNPYKVFRKSMKNDVMPKPKEEGKDERMDPDEERFVKQEER